MGYSIFIDWHEEFKENYDKWTNHGRDVLKNSCKHKTKETGENTLAEYSGACEKCNISEDSAEPMMNYAYPLELKDFDEEKILRVVKETNCTIMENQATGEWFLVLCGGGMDLSQDIGFAYIILERWIPKNLLTEIAKQPLLSLGNKNYKKLAKEVIFQLKNTRINFKQKEKEWKDSLKTLKEKEKQKK